MSIDFDNMYLDKVLEGNKNAFRYFVKEYQQMAYSIAISMVKSPQDAEDVTQNAFVRAYKNLRSFKGNSKFSSWFYKIVVNESLKNLSKKKRSSIQVYKEIENTGIEVTYNHAVSNIDLQEKKDAIQKCLDIMKPKEALILKLYYLHELSLEELIDSTGWSRSNVKVILYRARKSFMNIYINKYNNNEN